MKQLECRVVITHNEDGHTFALGMYDPLNMRHEPLGTNHPERDITRIVNDLKASMERAGHRVTFSEVWGKR